MEKFTQLLESSLHQIIISFYQKCPFRFLALLQHEDCEIAFPSTRYIYSFYKNPLLVDFIMSDWNFSSKVTVYSMQHLLAKEYAKSMSTYITVKKLPEKAVQRTSLHTKAVNPVFNNKFKFHVSSEDDVASQVLIFELNHMDRFCTSYLRGEVRLPLFQLDLSSRPRLLVPFLECRVSPAVILHSTVLVEGGGSRKMGASIGQYCISQGCFPLGKFHRANRHFFG